MALVKVPQEGSGQEGLGTSIQTPWEIFYANYGILVLLESSHLQGECDALTILFYLLGLWTNEGKTVSMACRPSHPPRMVNVGLHSTSYGTGKLV